MQNAATVKRFSESTFSDPQAPPRVDRKACIIRGVKCLGRESQNNRTYSEQALKDACSFYEGIGVNVDHPADPSLPRGMAEGFGVLRAPEIRGGGVYADLHFIESHPLAGPIIEWAEKFPGNFGMSHNAEGRVVEGDNGPDVVEGVDRVLSVDIVRNPATTAGLFESENRSKHAMAAKKTDKAKTHTIRSILEAHPKDKTAAALLVLLEEEDFAAAAEAPVEMEPATEEDAAKSIKAALRKMIMAAVDDESLGIGETLVKIKKILKSQEKVLAQLAPGDADDKGESEGSDAPPTLESVDARLTARLDAIDRRESLRELLEDRGLSRSDLSAPQRRAFSRAKDAEAAEDLLESWEVKPAATQTRPDIRARHLTEGGGDESYDKLKTEIRPAKGAG